MSAKALVKSFYDSDMANDESIVSKFFHEDCEMHWTSSQGFMILRYDDIVDFFKGTRKSYNNLRFEFSHLLEDGSLVMTRHTAFAKTIENPNSEAVLAYFSSIWEVKDGKLYRCYEISQQADENDSSAIASYLRRKI